MPTARKIAEQIETIGIVLHFNFPLHLPIAPTPTDFGDLEITVTEN
ncbi:hypothetical protein DSM3645_02513 [Blastopirellula marina DSM 3645]|uniref:Uncharacterized protein n=1 Tax=Blastopirellula marina DSM 3645 TaxID=314230 RepID=A3ZVG6_9BACT|nr:hypothetical protein DSM3645_02513 [Blastopirellula marina DSM 3645]